MARDYIEGENNASPALSSRSLSHSTHVSIVASDSPLQRNQYFGPPRPRIFAQEKAHLIARADLQTLKRTWLNKVDANYLAADVKAHHLFDGTSVQYMGIVCRPGSHPGMIALKMEKHVEGDAYKLRVYVRDVSLTEDVVALFQDSLGGLCYDDVEGNLPYYVYNTPIVLPSTPVDEDEEHGNETLGPKLGVAYMGPPNLPLSTKRRYHELFQDCLLESFDLRVGSWRGEGPAATRLVKRKEAWGCVPDTTKSFRLQLSGEGEGGGPTKRNKKE
mmetsp:Transcript_1781/g.5250  ORF Transcript_1781/g.5250 Transcript_1781/m.5250 type:complete len:274 (-) Transcript_1781:44-865(-)